MAGVARVQVDAVLKRALELSDEDRERFLDETCDRDTELRHAVERMLQACEEDEGPLLRPGGGASGPLWEALAGDYSAAFVIEPGERVGAYRVVRVLGRGGMATVYLAERADGQFEQAVALKVLDVSRDFESLAARFAQERRILASLEHPNIARLIDGGATRTGQPYVVMEYVDGEPVDAWCDRNGLSIDRRIKLFAKIASAVQYAHSHLIVHRDIKPSNILVTPGGEPKLLDFGIAKLLDTGSTAPVTRSALHPMTPEYASPEQVRGDPLTTASDVYQLGYLLYRLLTGHSPYACDRRNVAAMVQAICELEPARPSDAVLSAPGDDAKRGRSAAPANGARAATPERLRRRLAGDLDNILLTALSKEPERRYQSAVHLRDDLQRHLRGLPVTARPPTLRYRGVKFIGRHRAGVAASLLLALTLAGGIAATLWQAAATAREAMRAAQARDFLVGLFESVDPDATLGRTVTAKELLDRGAGELESGLADLPILRAEMLGVVGRMYTKLGLYQEARPLLEQARATLLAAGRQNSAALAQSAEDLATVLYEQGEYESAEQAARSALAIRRQRHLAEPEELSTGLLQLASVLNMRGQAEEAEPLYLEGIDIARQSSDETLLASHLSDYGVFLYRSARYGEALGVSEEALELHRRLYGAEHTLVATSLLNVSSAHAELGDFETAENLLRECLAMRQRLLGEKHPHVATAFNNLGNLLQEAGRLDEAEVALAQALSIRRATLGDAHPDVGNALNSLGIVQYFNARYSDAAETFEQVLPSWRDAYGATHPNVLSALNNLGAARREAGNYEGAEEVLRETLALRRQVFGDTHQHVAQSLNNLALVLVLQDKHSEAEGLFRDAIAMWRQTMGDDHPDVGDGLQAFGKFLLDRGRYGEAEPPLRESLAIRQRVLDPQAPLLASVRLYLGECLTRLDRAAEAEPLLLESLPVLVGRWGDDAPVTVRAKKALEDTRRALGAAARSSASSEAG